MNAAGTGVAPGISRPAPAGVELALPASLALVGAAVGVFGLGSWQAHLELTREGLAAGELWRVLTTHLTHWSLDHLFWDGLTVLVACLLCWRRSPRRTFEALLVGAFLVPLFSLGVSPELESYRGLSGLASTLFVLAGCFLTEEHLRAGRRGEAGACAVALGGFVLKVLYEAMTGATVFARGGGFVAVPMAHVVGGVVGVAAFLVHRHGSRVRP